ncbi:MAG TPA: hypothetical protein PKM97_02500 [Bacteroidia bacterium]|nr:hypothetical protein [Bacteroidia bacterium]
MTKLSTYLLIFLLHFISAKTFSQATHSGCAPKVSDKDWYTSGKKAPLFEGLDGINFPITTKSPEAQKYFNQGLMLNYAFNHAEAARSFYEAIRLDSSCAMCYWGFALVLGPNYNAGMEKDNYQRVYQAAQHALQMSNELPQKERMLIMALAMRYDSIPTEDRTWNDEAYAFTMASIAPIFPDDPDIATLHAEALMVQHPWDLWEANGTPKKWTNEIVKVLEKVLEKFPEHPGANHYYIHAVEASSTPERAMASADLLRNLVPGAGHLVHMPSHIYIRTGRYHEGTLANQKAIEVDDKYISSCHAQGVYPLAYFPHNFHFMAATASLEGDQTTAIMASKKMREQLDQNLLLDPKWGTLQHYYSIIYYVMVKFGMWDEILKEQTPSDDLPYPKAILEYAKGMASLARKDFSAAQQHLSTLEKLSADSSAKAVSIWDMNTADELMSIAMHVLKGELLNVEGKTDHAVEELKKALAIEDRLLYNEPPDWFFSVRHNLAAILLEKSMYSEAEIYLREDLKKYPLNGWALIGLSQALQFQGKMDEARKTELQFEEAWKYSTIKIKSCRIL